MHPGDEVIVLEPCYDSYVPNIELAGGTRGARAADAGQLPARLRRASPRRVTPRTRAIIVNTPHNPSATVWTRDDMLQLAELLRPTDVLLIADEVYEHMVYDGAPHASAASHPAAGGARLRRLELRQDLPRHRLEGRLRGRAGAR